MEKLPHQKLKRLPLTRKQSQHGRGGVSLRVELTPVRLSNRSTKDALGAQSIKMRDDADHQALQKAGAVWQRHQTEEKQRWPDWIEILGPALVKVQDEAMDIASTDKPQGKRYAQAASGLLKTYQLDEIGGATRSHAVRIVQNLEVVTDWRAKQDEPERLNHPTTVWRSFALSEEWRGIQAERGIKPKERRSSPKPTKKQLEALQAELDSALTDRERAEDERETLRRALEAKNVAPASAKEDGDHLGIPGFLGRAAMESPQSGPLLRNYAACRGARGATVELG